MEDHTLMEGRELKYAVKQGDFPKNRRYSTQATVNSNPKSSKQSEFKLTDLTQKEYQSESTNHVDG